MSRQLTSNLLGLIGAVAGGTLGYYTFMWIADQGYYGLMIPGGLLGLGCGLLSRHTSNARGLVCAAMGAGLGLFTEWRFAPFKADRSLVYFLGHIGDLKPITLLMIAAGAFFASWLGRDAGLRFFPATDRKASDRGEIRR